MAAPCPYIGTLEQSNTGTFFNAIMKVEIDIRKGATGFDGGYEVQVACRGAVTTLKGSTKHKRQHRTGTRSLIKLCASPAMSVNRNQASTSRLV